MVWNNICIRNPTGARVAATPSKTGTIHAGRVRAAATTSSAVGETGATKPNRVLVEDAEEIACVALVRPLS